MGYIDYTVDSFNFDLTSTSPRRRCSFAQGYPMQIFYFDAPDFDIFVAFISIGGTRSGRCFLKTMPGWNFAKKICNGCGINSADPAIYLIHRKTIRPGKPCSGRNPGAGRALSNGPSNTAPCSFNFTMRRTPSITGSINS